MSGQYMVGARSGHVKSCQVSSGHIQIMSGQYKIRSGQVRSSSNRVKVRRCQIRTRYGHARSAHVSSGHVMSGQIRFGQVKCASKSGKCQDKIRTRSCPINSDQSQERESHIRLNEGLFKVRSGQVISRTGQIRIC